MPYRHAVYTYALLAIAAQFVFNWELEDMHPEAFGFSPILYRMYSHRIVSHRIVSCHIVSYHIVSYRVIPCPQQRYSYHPSVMVYYTYAPLYSEGWIIPLCCSNTLNVPNDERLDSDLLTI